MLSNSRTREKETRQKKGDRHNRSRFGQKITGALAAENTLARTSEADARIPFSWLEQDDPDEKDADERVNDDENCHYRPLFKLETLPHS